MRTSQLLLLLGAGLLAAACSNDSAEDLAPAPPPGAACDSTAFTYALVVAPLLQQRCVSCHNNTVRNGNVSLATHAQVQQVAANGRLLGTITHAPGFPPMPQGAPKLAPCDIARLRQWVRAGAPNN